MFSCVFTVVEQLLVSQANVSSAVNFSLWFWRKIEMDIQKEKVVDITKARNFPFLLQNRSSHLYCRSVSKEYFCSLVFSEPSVW